MKRILLALPLAFVVFGCGPKDAAPSTATTPTASNAPGAPGSVTTPGGSGNSVEIMPTGVPNAPVMNSDAVTGAGSGAGQVAKDRAKGVQGKMNAGATMPDSDVDDGG